MSLDQGIFPKELKLANVIPLYKAEDPVLLTITGLCHYWAIYQRYLRKLCIPDWSNTLNCTECWLITHTFILYCFNELISSLEKDESVICIFLDFSKAFDTVDHAILLCKLEHYGIRGNALSWFKSYLTDRGQFVTFNGASSATKLISCGVPMESILGPLLFSIYIHDLHVVYKNTFPILFADDTNLFTIGTDLDVMQNTLNDELNEISTSLKVNTLSLIVKKLTLWFSPGRKCVKNLLLWKSTVKTLVKSWKQNS